MRSLAASLPAVTRKVLGRHGLAEGGLITGWRDIVGAEIAARSLPVRLSFPAGERRDGTLLVRVAGALALELQHLEPLVVERINGHFGYRAVARLKILQGPVPTAAEPPPRAAPPAAADDAAIDALVAGVGDEGLRAALHGFGCSLRRAAARKSRR